MTDQTVDPGDSTPDNQSRPQRDTAPSGAAESVPQATSESAAAGESSRSSSDGGASAASSDGTPSGDGGNRPRRRRGSRGGRNRNRSGGGQGGGANASGDEGDDSDETGTPDFERQPDELPKRASQSRPRDSAAAEEVLVKKPQIGDSRPDPAADSAEAESGDRDAAKPEGQGGGQARSGNRRRRGGRGRGGGGGGQQQGQGAQQGPSGQQGQSGQQKGQQQKKAGAPRPVEAILGGDGPELDDETLEKRKGRERNGRPVGRYMMAVSVRPEATQIAVLEGRNLIEHYVSRPADDVAQEKKVG